ncbi:MAG: glycosyltransferase, partial [Microbacteriaceae bacterium]|nr:glycosyltransferase [Microbacteriaceae bacterium]
YRQWRRHYDLAPTLTAGSASAPFLVIVEDGPPSAVNRTRESVRRQRLSADAFVAVVAVGTDLVPLVEREAFVLFVRAGTVFRPWAFESIAHEARANPTLQVIGFDTESGRGPQKSPRFRPRWSPELLLSYNYLGRAVAVRGEQLVRRGHVEATDRGWWKALLEAGLSDGTVGTLSRVLASEPRDAAPFTELDAAMVADVLKARGEVAEVSVASASALHVAFAPARWPSVSIVIPTRHSRANLDRLIPSLRTTDYPAWDVRIMDNGGFSNENASWYEQVLGTLPVEVEWWTESPFNYSRVNNRAAEQTAGEVIVFLNDDTEIVDPQWLQVLVGHLMRDGVGIVGAQLREARGLIQHGGVTLGPGGFADNTFSGLRPGSDTLIGPTDAMRNSLAATGACLAIRRTHFDEVGGFDERFILCGSDVVLGLEQVLRGRRNVIVARDMVRHLESVTRGSSVPAEDFYASYWRYVPWLQNGDPYWSPGLSPLVARPTLASPHDPDPARIALRTIGRPYVKQVQRMDISSEASNLLRIASASSAEVARVTELHAQHTGRIEPTTVNWFIPDIDMPFFGGLNTAFRLAAWMQREHGVHHRFVVLSGVHSDEYVRSAVAAAYPELAGSDVHYYDGTDTSNEAVPGADMAVATLWLTAPHVVKSTGVARKFYLVQDYEPAFYPASSMYAMAEETYRMGLYGLCNTTSMHRVYQAHGGSSRAFAPAVDRALFNPAGRREKHADEPVTIFAYARDHFRNCWELVFAALTEVKQKHGDNVRIVVAGARHLPASADFVDLGLLDYRATAALYRETDIGITMQISRHPSYLPLELMASGAAMVAPDSNWFRWLFDDENALLTMRTVDDIVAKLNMLIESDTTRAAVQAAGLRTIDEGHSDWDAVMSGIYDYMVDPEAETHVD